MTVALPWGADGRQKTGWIGCQPGSAAAGGPWWNPPVISPASLPEPRSWPPPGPRRAAASRRMRDRADPGCLSPVQATTIFYQNQSVRCLLSPECVQDCRRQGWLNVILHQAFICDRRAESLLDVQSFQDGCLAPCTKENTSIEKQEVQEGNILYASATSIRSPQDAQDPSKNVFFETLGCSTLRFTRLSCICEDELDHLLRARLRPLQEQLHRSRHQLQLHRRILLRERLPTGAHQLR